MFDMELENLAIRPESIYIREEGRNYVEGDFIIVEGVMRDSAVLGNIIRYRVERKGISFTVALLNRGESRYYEINSKMNFMFMKNQLKFF